MLRALVMAPFLFAAVLASCRNDGDGIDSTDPPQAPQTPQEEAIVRRCGGTPDHVVTINDFAYDPPSLTVKVGDMVAWVNLEECGDSAPEGVVTPLTGCDSHHQVVTAPTTGDSVDSGPICSPHRGLPGSGVDLDNCDDEGGINVFCHTFTQPGTQHYTCFTNPGHALAMHGFITVSE